MMKSKQVLGCLKLWNTSTYGNILCFSSLHKKMTSENLPANIRKCLWEEKLKACSEDELQEVERIIYQLNYRARVAKTRIQQEEWFNPTIVSQRAVEDYKKHQEMLDEEIKRVEKDYENWKSV